MQAALLSPPDALPAHLQPDMCYLICGNIIFPPSRVGNPTICALPLYMFILVEKPRIPSTTVPAHAMLSPVFNCPPCSSLSNDAGLICPYFLQTSINLRNSGLSKLQYPRSVSRKSEPSRFVNSTSLSSSYGSMVCPL